MRESIQNNALPVFSGGATAQDILQPSGAGGKKSQTGGDADFAASLISLSQSSVGEPVDGASIVDTGQDTGADPRLIIDIDPGAVNLPVAHNDRGLNHTGFTSALAASGRYTNAKPENAKQDPQLAETRTATRLAKSGRANPVNAFGKTDPSAQSTQRAETDLPQDASPAEHRRAEPVAHQAVLSADQHSSHETESNPASRTPVTDTVEQSGEQPSQHRPVSAAPETVDLGKATSHTSDSGPDASSTTRPAAIRTKHNPAAAQSGLSPEASGPAAAEHAPANTATGPVVHEPVRSDTTSSRSPQRSPGTETGHQTATRAIQPETTGVAPAVAGNASEPTEQPVVSGEAPTGSEPIAVKSPTRKFNEPAQLSQAGSKKPEPVQDTGKPVVTNAGITQESGRQAAEHAMATATEPAEPDQVKPKTAKRVAGIDSQRQTIDAKDGSSQAGTEPVAVKTAAVNTSLAASDNTAAIAVAPHEQTEGVAGVSREPESVSGIEDSPVELPPIDQPLDPDNVDEVFQRALGDRLITAVRQDLNRAEIRVTPSELGPITIELSVDGDAATVVFSADQSNTRVALQDSLQSLRDHLSQEGISLTEASVSDNASANPETDDRDSGSDERHGNQSLANAGSDSGQDQTISYRPPAREHGLVDLFV